MLITPLVQSISDVRFYGQLARRPLVSVLVFFTILTLLLNSLPGYKFITRSLPEFAAQLHQDIETLKTDFPLTDQLVWDGTNLSANFSQPLVLNYPAVMGGSLTNLPKVFVTYVPSHEQPQIIAQDLDQSTYILLSKSSLSFTDFAGGWSSLSLTEVLAGQANFTLTKDGFDQYLSQLQLKLNSLLTANPQVFFGSYLAVSYLSHLLTALVYAVMSFFISSIYKLKLHFIHLCKVSLHLVILAQLTDLIAQQLYPDLGWSMFSLSYWILLTWVIIYLQKADSNQTPPHKTAQN